MTSPTLVAVGDNPTMLWGMTNAERVRRIGVAQKYGGGGDRSPSVF